MPAFSSPSVRSPYRPRVPRLNASGGWTPPNPANGTPAYVRKTGNDGNGGTSPSDAWLTVNHALQTAAPGSTIYVGAGTYRETVQVTITPTGSLPVAVVGDVDGFWTGDVGMVQITAYTTSDSTQPSATTLLNLNGKNFLTFTNIMFVGGNAILATATTPSQGITFTDCAFTAGRILALGLVSCTSTFGTPLNWTFDRCYFMCGAANGSLLFTATSGVGIDYDLNVVIRNSFFLGGDANTIRVAGGASANKGNGVHVNSCSFLGPTLNVGANTSLQFPSTVYNCFSYNPSTTATLAASSTGMIVEDYNLLVAATPRTNVNTGTHSRSDGSYAPLFHFGQERNWGGNPRPFGEPMASSPLSVFGSDGNQTPYDLRNGPRPSGILRAAVGALERGNNFIRETGTVHTGSNAISCIGDGFYDFDVAVDAGPVTVTAFCQYDSNYAGPQPELRFVPNEEIDVGNPSVATDPTSLNAWKQLSLTANPSGSGVLTVRVVASDYSGLGKTTFDSFAVS
jgi:hypothetical protein